VFSQAEVDNIIFCTSDSPPLVVRLVIQREVPPERSLDAQKLSEKIGDKSSEAIADYIAHRLDSIMSESLDRAISLSGVQDPGSFGALAEGVNGFQESFHNILVGAPAEAAASSLDIPDGTAICFVAEHIPIGSVDRSLGSARLFIEITGIFVGMAVGLPMMTSASVKAFVHDVFRRTMAAGIRHCINNSLCLPPEKPSRVNPASSSLSEDSYPKVTMTTYPDRRVIIFAGRVKPNDAGGSVEIEKPRGITPPAVAVAAAASLSSPTPGARRGRRSRGSRPRPGGWCMR